MKKRTLLIAASLLAFTVLSSFDHVAPLSNKNIIKHLRRQAVDEVYLGYVFDGGVEIRLYGHWINDAQVKGYITSIEYYDGTQFVPAYYLNPSATIYGEGVPGQPAVAKFNWKYVDDSEPLHSYNDTYNQPW